MEKNIKILYILRINLATYGIQYHNYILRTNIATQGIKSHNYIPRTNIAAQGIKSHNTLYPTSKHRSVGNKILQYFISCVQTSQLMEKNLTIRYILRTNIATQGIKYHNILYTTYKHRSVGNKILQYILYTTYKNRNIGNKISQYLLYPTYKTRNIGNKTSQYFSHVQRLRILVVGS